MGNTAPGTSELHLRFSLVDSNDEVLHQGDTAAKAVSFLSRIVAVSESDLRCMADQKLMWKRQA